MILLEPGNRILGEVVSNVIMPAGEEKRDALDVRLCDFDDVTYRVQVEKGGNSIKVSMSCPCYHQIEEHGAKASFEKAFGAHSVEPESPYHLAVSIDFTALKDEAEKTAMCKKLSLFKSITVGGIFGQYFDALTAKKESKPHKFDLRGDTTVYLVPKNDRVTLVYEVNFSDKVDKCVAKVFMQEFVDSKKKLGSAPPMAYNVNPPQELKSFGVTENNGALGYLSFAILPRHVADEKKKDKAIKTLTTFRNYIQYHIKCSKTHFHSKMRFRASELLKVLNRAKAANPKDKKEKKTASGRTFKRN